MNMQDDDPERIPIEMDQEMGLLTTPVGRDFGSGEDAIQAACPSHGDLTFHYNRAMDAWFCEEYWWGSEEDAPEDACDSVILAADMAEDPDGGPVRHRNTMEKVTEEEYSLGRLHHLGQEVSRKLGEEKFKITSRKEPTPPPGFKG